MIGSHPGGSGTSDACGPSQVKRMHNLTPQHDVIERRTRTPYRPVKAKNKLEHLKRGLMQFSKERPVLATVIGASIAAVALRLLLRARGRE